MAINALHVSSICTILSLASLKWWSLEVFGKIKADGFVDGDKDDDAGRLLELLLGSHGAIALMLNLAVNVFVLALLCLKSIFFVQLTSSEMRKVLERTLHYVFSKGIVLLLIIPPNVLQVAIWSSWVVSLSSLKIFQMLAKERLERMNASPSATPWTYFRVYSTLLMVLFADLLWMRFCTIIHDNMDATILMLLFFEPLSIAFDTLQALMVHGIHLLELWNRHPVNHFMDCLGVKSSKFAAGCFGEWKSILVRDFSFFLDMLTLLTSLGHYIIIWWLHGLGFHLLDAVLFMNLRGLVGGIVKRVRGYFRLRKALLSLDVSLPDATSAELRTFDDECAICREPMSRAKKLSCNHLFHLSCLKSWLDQGLADGYSCPTCRRPLFLFTSRENSSSGARDASPSGQLSLSNSETGERRESMPSPNVAWRGSGFDASTSSLDRVQLMMRHLSSMGETYADDASWNLWPAAASSGPTTPLTLRNRRSTGLRFRSPQPSSSSSIMETSSEMLAMVGRVREVLPHIPDELIIQDLRRTNNVVMTVNNFLPT